MINEQKQLNSLDKAHEGHQPSDKALKGETIKSKDENALNEKQKARDAVKSFKLTKDGQESCMIVGLTDKSGKAIVVKDERPLRRDLGSEPKETQAKVAEGSQTQDVVQKNGDKVHVTTTHNADGSATETSLKPNGDKEVVQRDSHGRETEREKSHKPRFGENSVDEKIVTTYDEKTGMPKTTSTKYDMVGRESEKTTSDVLGNSHNEQYSYGRDNSKHVSETSDVDVFNGKTVNAKYDEQDRKVSQDTNYKNRQFADHETWTYGPGGIAIHEKNGRIDDDAQWLQGKNGPHGDDGLSIKPFPLDTQTHQVLGPDGVFDQVTSTKNSDGSSVKKTTHPDGATESVSKDAQERETERVRTHQTPLGEVIDERVQTSYNKQTGWPEATTSHYDLSGRETERVTEDAFGNHHTEKYAYDANNKKYTSEETDLNRVTGTSINTKYDAQHHPTERTTKYSDGRPADHDRWYEATGGVTIHEKNGQIVSDTTPILRDAGAAHPMANAAENLAHGATDSRATSSRARNSQAGEAHSASRDSVHVDDSTRASHTAMERSKEHLLHTIEHLKAEGKLSEKDFEKFKQNMDRLQERVKLRYDDPIEGQKTYEQMDKLVTEPKAVISEKNRILLAENVLYHAAWPHNIDQGKYETCNMTTVQENIFTRHPSKAAELITSAALHGGFDSARKHIQIDAQSLWPQPESLTSPPGDNCRSYATQVLNVLLVNDVVQRFHPPQYYSQIPAGHKGGPPGDATHRDSTDPKDVGERLTDGHGNEILDTHGTAVRAPGDAGNTDNIAAELKRLTGDTQVVITDKSDVPGDADVVHVGSPADLEQALKTHKMPMIIAIDANNPPFGGKNGGRFGNAPAWHVVTIQSYDAKHHKAHISNQWGASGDIDVPLNVLYHALYEFHRPVPPPVPPPVPHPVPPPKSSPPLPWAEDSSGSSFSSFESESL